MASDAGNPFEIVTSCDEDASFNEKGTPNLSTSTADTTSSNMAQRDSKSGISKRSFSQISNSSNAVTQLPALTTPGMKDPSAGQKGRPFALQICSKLLQAVTDSSAKSFQQKKVVLKSLQEKEKALEKANKTLVALKEENATLKNIPGRREFATLMNTNQMIKAQLQAQREKNVDLRSHISSLKDIMAEEDCETKDNIYQLKKELASLKDQLQPAQKASQDEDQLLQMQEDNKSLEDQLKLLRESNQSREAIMQLHAQTNELLVFQDQAIKREREAVQRRIRSLESEKKSLESIVAIYEKQLQQAVKKSKTLNNCK